MLLLFSSGGVEESRAHKFVGLGHSINIFGQQFWGGCQQDFPEYFQTSGKLSAYSIKLSWSMDGQGDYSSGSARVIN